MKAVTLMFHDAVTDGEYDESGFSGAGADLYKLGVTDMDGHFGAVSGSGTRRPGSVLDFPGQETSAGIPLYLTFDDGGVGAALHTAGLLEKYGWTGHFFITTDRIGERRFLDRTQIRGLRGAGHVIGSHSASHPKRISSLGPGRLDEEWGRSLEALSDILGEAVTAASVPGGYYSRSVAESAAAAGIRALFTSEPVMRCWKVDGCLVLGRYTVNRNMKPADSADLCRPRMTRRKLRQYWSWNIRKAAKCLGGGLYDSAREGMLGKR
jgi:peptidoglycan/xylan/chitin deacetylase (PgdA/CDA1 family)